MEFKCTGECLKFASLGLVYLGLLPKENLLILLSSIAEFSCYLVQSHNSREKHKLFYLGGTEKIKSESDCSETTLEQKIKMAYDPGTNFYPFYAIWEAQPLISNSEYSNIFKPYWIFYSTVNFKAVNIKSSVDNYIYRAWNFFKIKIPELRIWFKN